MDRSTAGRGRRRHHGEAVASPLHEPGVRRHRERSCVRRRADDVGQGAPRAPPRVDHSTVAFRPFEGGARGRRQRQVVPRRPLPERRTRCPPSSRILRPRRRVAATVIPRKSVAPDDLSAIGRPRARRVSAASKSTRSTGHRPRTAWAECTSVPSRRRVRCATRNPGGGNSPPRSRPDSSLSPVPRTGGTPRRASTSPSSMRQLSTAMSTTTGRESGRRGPAADAPATGCGSATTGPR